MKIYVKDHAHNANKWIYNGYASAWNHLGFDVKRYNEIKEIDDSDHLIMATDWSIKDEKDLEILEKAKKVFLFVQPTKYEEPWSSHPNFMCFLPEKIINKINGMKNVHKWTFVDHDRSDYYFVWNNLYKYPLAFDNLAYYGFETNQKYKFDICYIGGRAHNGFDEKYKIMLKTFSAFKDSGLKCGFFIEKNLSHEQEKNIIFNSKICLNVHDANQLKTNLDTNERTFKTLGINGGLVCSSNGQLNRLFPDVKTSNEPGEIVSIAKELCNLPDQDLFAIKEKNKKEVNTNHTYTSRVKQMVEHI